MVAAGSRPAASDTTLGAALSLKREGRKLTHDLAKLFIDGATFIAAAVLAFVTWQLVRVTRHHAHYAEKMAAAADRLGEILDRQASALAEVAELNALVSAMAARYMNLSGHGSHEVELKAVIDELHERRKARAQQH